jgi:hypothetical protein
MKFTKMLGICVIAALVMAMAGAGTASATTLCKASEDPCGAGNRYPSGTKFTMSLQTGTQFVLKTSTGAEQKCPTGTLLPQTGAESAASLPLTFETKISGCGGSCTTTQILYLPWSGSLEATGSGKGTLVLKKVGFRLSGCPLGLTCEFIGENLETSMSGSPLQAAYEKTPLTLASGPPLLCGEGTLNAAYVVTSPSSLFIAKAP